MPYAVLTGDIVDSTAMAPDKIDETMTQITSVAKLFGGRFARRGGDGWQIALPDPVMDLRCALMVAAVTRRAGRDLATRIALARDDQPMPDTPDLNAAHGAGFTASGRLLDRLERGPLMAHAEGGTTHATTALAADIADGWTPAQARTVAEALHPDAGPRSAIADALGVSRQAVDQALNAARWPALTAALTAWEAATCP
ncbi:MarR family transcriptional regulator [Sagittula sp. SSi028]|uniref:MarR family transcriptional regulator n=1 Tax=Sagittula sp. SSi028 TaxID=3400636 RepID=UPI003AF945F4